MKQITLQWITYWPVNIGWVLYNLVPIEEKEDPKTYKRWRAEMGGKYCYINSIGDIDIMYEGYSEYDNRRYSIWNYYQTEEEAQKAFNKQLAIVRINDRIMELNGNWVADRNDADQCKYTITTYDHADKKFRTDYHYVCIYSCSIQYMKSYEIANQIISEMESDLKIAFDIL